MNECKLTTNEAYAVAEFIDMNLLDAIRNDPEWDSVANLRALIHVYEKACKYSGYLGLTETNEGEA